MGFSAWKNALARFAKHKSSDTPREAVTKVHNVRTVNIAAAMCTKVKEQQLRRQRTLLKHLSSLRYLCQQGITTRSHKDGEGSYLMQLLRMWSEHDSDLKERLREGKYLSYQIINDQLKLMADAVLRQLLSEIRDAKFFSVIADEATDVACKEHLSIVIRWVSCEYEIHEEPVGLVQLPKTDSATIYEALKDVSL